ncbi:leucine-rich repeat domain-containing protein [Cytophaga aurantiaca]|uniref:leucine-rich repeat domain-containing protein n=1 Tax=Cytophaga aurantiaca TaxID=29530 RepID=UPI000365C6BF|nr:leucine-rich repeat domain-containing protein [Cytophaga aurantiaca]
MKKLFFLTALILSGIFSVHTDAKAQAAYDTLCEYKTYYSLEDALKDPLNVQKLDLSMQKLTVFPDQILQLKNLVCLDLSFNKIPTLPATFSTLTNLKVLNLMGTRYMSKTPPVLTQMPNLLVLDLRDHPEWPAATFDAAVKLLPNVTIIK